MAGADPTITIPTVGISNADGDRIKSALDPGPVNVTLRDGTTATEEDSYRWLIGEKSTGLRRGDPRHVDADLPGRPRQGVGR